MSAYLMITYDISDHERFADYSPGGLAAILTTIASHGGEPTFAGPPDAVTGSAPKSAVCIKFPDADAAKAWLDDPDYAPLKAIRMESTSNVVEYVLPGVG